MWGFSLMRGSGGQSSRKRFTCCLGIPGARNNTRLALSASSHGLVTTPALFNVNEKLGCFLAKNIAKHLRYACACSMDASKQMKMWTTLREEKQFQRSTSKVWTCKV